MCRARIPQNASKPPSSSFLSRPSSVTLPSSSTFLPNLIQPAAAHCKPRSVSKHGTMELRVPASSTILQLPRGGCREGPRATLFHLSHRLTPWHLLLLNKPVQFSRVLRSHIIKHMPLQAQSRGPLSNGMLHDNHHIPVAIRTKDPQSEPDPSCYLLPNNLLRNSLRALPDLPRVITCRMDGDTMLNNLSTIGRDYIRSHLPGSTTIGARSVERM